MPYLGSLVILSPMLRLDVAVECDKFGIITLDSRVVGCLKVLLSRVYFISVKSATLMGERLLGVLRKIQFFCYSYLARSVVKIFLCNRSLCVSDYASFQS